MTGVGDDMEPGEGGVEDGDGGGGWGGGGSGGHIGAGDRDVGEDDGGQQGAGEEDAHKTDADHIAGAAAAHDGLNIDRKILSGYPELLTHSCLRTFKMIT